MMENRARRPRARRDGSAAIEFAIVALPFFFVIFAILELGVIFLVDSVMETAVQQTSRLVRTGQAQEQGITGDDFRSRLCANMIVFEGDCLARAIVDVRVIPQFNDPGPPNPVVNGEFDTSQLGYQAGDAGDLMLVRVWYEQPVFTPILSKALTPLDSGGALIVVTAAFRNEPF